MHAVPYFAPMRCLGLNGSLRRCNRKGDWRFFCHDHSKLPLVWGGFLIFTVGGGLASILSYIGQGPATITNRVPETNSTQSASAPAILPSPKESETPKGKVPDNPNHYS